MYLVFTPFAEREKPGARASTPSSRDVRRRLAGVQIGDHLPADPAGDPGPGRLQRLPDAARAAGRQHRPRPAGGLRPVADRGRAQPVGHRRGQHLVPQRRAADLRRRRPDPGREPGRADRRRVLDAAVLHRARATSTSSTCSTRAIRPTSRPTAAFRLEPEDIEQLRTRNNAGEMVPLGRPRRASRYTQGAATISRYNLYPTVGLMARRPPASAPARPWT